MAVLCSDARPSTEVRRASDPKTPRTDIPVPRAGLAHVRGRGRGVGFRAVAGLDLLDAFPGDPEASVHGQRARRTEQAVADTVQFRNRRARWPCTDASGSPETASSRS